MTTISKDIQTQVLNRLKLNEPITTNLEFLEHLYFSWCQHVPFDNLRKMISMKSNYKGKLPGMDAADFFENWLINGSGATCWPMANAFYELLISIGFDAKRIAGNMRDLGLLNHGSVKVSINGLNYLTDASLLLNKVFLLGHDTIIENNPVFPAEIEKDGDSHLLWLLTPPGKSFFYCRVNSNPVDFLVFDNGYEKSRDHSIFNQRLYARRNFSEKLIVLWGNLYYVKTIMGIECHELTREEVCRTLHIEFGISEKLLNEWVACGCLEASFEIYSGPAPPHVPIKPPSLR